MPLSRIDNEGLTGPIGGRRNLLINGAQQVFQRSTSATGVTTDTYSAPDRWKTRVGDSSEFTISQSSTTPDGFANSTKWDCTTANTSLSSGSFIIYEQRIEAQDLQHLQYGTSSAKAITVSFYVRSNKTGVYTVGLFANDGPRHIQSSYTINSANTFEKKTITFPGDTGGTINDDTGEGLRVWFWLGAGTDFTSGTHATSWEDNTAANYVADNQVNLADSTSNEWYITGVQLEVGTVATEFEHRSFSEELALCRRYFYKNTTNTSAFQYRGDYRLIQEIYPTEMRANPTVVVSEVGGAGTFSASSFASAQKIIQFTAASSTLTTTHYVSAYTADAEL